MTIGVPRAVIVGLAVFFSAYHLVLAAYTIGEPRDPAPVALAMGLYAAATVIVLLPFGPTRMPLWMAALAFATVVAITLLVAGQLSFGQPGGTGFSTWYVAASGTLLTITSGRGRHAFAWIGIGFLVLHTIVVIQPVNPEGIFSIGVVGSAVWVAVAHVLVVALGKASSDAQSFALAEREATAWQAAEEAHLQERQTRLGHTSTMALGMLQEIQRGGGVLSQERKQECLYLESAIRDEIRGRSLLNDAVREQVSLTRRRGASVALLDEGGLDELPAEELEHIRDQLAQAIGNTRADKVIARTVAEGSDVAVTVVGLRSVATGDQATPGQDSIQDDEVELWLEIPRGPLRPQAP